MTPEAQNRILRPLIAPIEVVRRSIAGECADCWRIVPSWDDDA